MLYRQLPAVEVQMLIKDQPQWRWTKLNQDTKAKEKDTKVEKEEGFGEHGKAMVLEKHLVEAMVEEKATKYMEKEKEREKDTKVERKEAKVKEESQEQRKEVRIVEEKPSSEEMCAGFASKLDIGETNAPTVGM